jgi:uncharacterized protein YqjF (DUF2071 family)
MICETSNQEAVRFTHAPSALGRQRILSSPGEPLFFAAWDRVLMIHFEVEAEALQRDVPFPLDLLNGRAFVSLVMFTMRGLRPRRGGRLAAWLFRPIATHDFLNVRTYVRQGDEPGIHFLAEWLSNRLAVKLGPRAFGLPYRHGDIAYNHDWHNGVIRGRVGNSGNELVYHAKLPNPVSFRPCEEGSLEEWLLERYTAFNSAGGRKRFFRVWHPPWPKSAMEAVIEGDSLLTRIWPWFSKTNMVGANFSPGVADVWMGRPHSMSAQ